MDSYLPRPRYAGEALSGSATPSWVVSPLDTHFHAIPAMAEEAATRITVFVHPEQEHRTPLFQSVALLSEQLSPRDRSRVRFRPRDAQITMFQNMAICSPFLTVCGEARKQAELRIPRAW